jgi:D-xylose transport system permease protein
VQVAENSAEAGKVAVPAPEPGTVGRRVAAVRDAVLRSGIDPRLASMLLALLGIWVGLGLLTDGLFLTPRNLYNLSVQTCVTAVMACGMVFLIVARQIDLSVGSLLALSGMVIAFTQVRLVDTEAWWGWAASIVLGAAVGVAVGLFQGWWVAYQRVPAFVVTLAGYLMYRGAAFLVADGQTIAPLHPTYARLGGGIGGSIGARASVALGVVAALVLAWRTIAIRRGRARYGGPLSPAWVDAAKIAIEWAAIAAFVAVMSLYPDPTNLGADGHPEGKGIGVPVLLLIAVALALNFLARRTRFGRYVFAYGGNPEAAILSGINTRRLLLRVFGLMGLLAALAGVITTARLNSGANSIGQLAELYVIAAAVIGGTSLSGGVGSVPGALVGALMIQSLDNGMVLLGVSSPKRQIIIGLVLIAAVWFDALQRRREEK